MQLSQKELREMWGNDRRFSHEDKTGADKEAKKDVTVTA